MPDVIPKFIKHLRVISISFNCPDHFWECGLEPNFIKTILLIHGMPWVHIFLHKGDYTVLHWDREGFSREFCSVSYLGTFLRIVLCLCVEWATQMGNTLALLLICIVHCSWQLIFAIPVMCHTVLPELNPTGTEQKRRHKLQACVDSDFWNQSECETNNSKLKWMATLSYARTVCTCSERNRHWSVCTLWWHY